MKDKYLHEQHFRNTLQKNMAGAKSSRKDEIDVLRTAFWFAEVKTRINASSFYAIEKFLEPEAFWKNEENRHIHMNKWPKYEVGQHVPSNSLTTRVNAKLPGTKRILNHVLWKTLQAKYWTKECADDWLIQLGPDIQGVMFQTHRYGTSESFQRIHSSRNQLIQIERRSGFDALACLTILLRESCEQGENPFSIEIGKSIFRMLLVLCRTNLFGNFAQEIFDVYRNKIFSLPRCNGQIFRLETFNFLEAVGLLNILVLQINDRSKSDQNGNGLVEVMYKLLDGDYGFDAKFALDPPIGPCDPLNEFNSKEWGKFERYKRFRQWGKEQIFSDYREILPPNWLW